MTYTITENKMFESLEIGFSEKPSEKIREVLKSFKFRWNPKKSIWYGFADKKELENALNNGETQKTEKKKEKEFDFNVKVGDLFCSQWGYEQTNVTFFQIIELIGKKSVRVREVYPQIIEQKAVTGMSEDRKYKVDCEILPPAERSSFIKDQQKGDVKRLKSYHQDARNNPQFEISSYADAYKYNGEFLSVSWYY